MEPYTDRGPVDCNVDFDTSHVKGKTAIITGGANGMGEAYVRALTAAGAYVVLGDVDEQAGRQIESECSGNAHFVVCDVSQWKDQLAMFKAALSNSPSKRIDFVVANAGISGYDDIFHNDIDAEHPEEPQMRILKVNGIGALYTTKLALHYFRRQYKLDPEGSKDQLLIQQGSLAGYIDLKGSMQYGFSKWGMRGIMRNLRRTEHASCMRSNYIAPWFVKTGILSQAAIENLEKAGTEFATVEAAARAVMKICSDTSINGRAFTICPESVSKSGYLDLDTDEYDKEPLKTWSGLASGTNIRLMSKEQQATKSHSG